MDRCASRFFAGLLMAVVVCIAFGQVSVAASDNCTIDDEERTVLGTVLKSISVESRSVLVIETGTDSSDFARIFRLTDLLFHDAAPKLSSQLEAVPHGSTVFLSTPVPIIPKIQQRELERDYDAKLSQPCRIPTMNDRSKLPLFTNSAEIGKIFSHNAPRDGWIRFHRIFGKDAELLMFSRVAFDVAKQYALVHVCSGCSEMGQGTGVLYLATRLNRSWVIKGTFVTYAPSE